ncbi:glycosyl transferase family 17 protein [Cordyceps militaris CM01]|uniref:Glycosyl transferase family 17 protein n=1 Tax=Cordyceps militaris (strain CM01) TaxID=983644 RepID=G3J6X1_CORMM|nr:glycosyl transferase family 17 protein [Cordyceps militaris CM01]EGX96248.1 glycosyl transferase family 17 protein [Cordyceps militaris CM01]
MLASACSVVQYGHIGSQSAACSLQLIFPATFHPRQTCDYEDLQRDATYEQVVRRLDGQELAPMQGDVIVVADIDEIPRPQSLLVLQSCNYPRGLTLPPTFYYYSFKFLHTGPEWPQPPSDVLSGLAHPLAHEPAQRGRRLGAAPWTGKGSASK